MIRLLSSIFLLFILLFFFLSFLFYNKSFFGILKIFEIFEFNWVNIKFYFLFDNISIFFVILSAFLLVICIFISWHWVYNVYLYFFCILLSMICLLNIFLTIDIFILFIFFEFIVIPLFLIVGVWGSRDRKILASYMLFMYTMVGSIFSLFAFIFLYFDKGSSNFFFFFDSIFLYEYQFIIFLFLFLGFAVKIPMVPLHIWLPEAHVEAPTAGSVILAGIVLKLGFYVYLRLIVFNFVNIISLFISFIFILSFIGLYLASFSAIAQIDMKKIIAYSSISHMNFSLIGLFSGNIIAIMGSFFMMFGHAIVSSALFSSIGILYDRYKTRLLFYYGGLVLLMPIWVVFLFFFILGNFGLPGTINFVGEILIFIGSFITSNFIILFCLLGLFLTLVYSIFLYTRLATGLIRVFFIRFYGDLTRREFIYMFVFVFFTIYFGIFPNVLFDYSFSSIFFWMFN
jgi:proton-translocating NADH-quinone oxidoreductase chain M